MADVEAKVKEAVAKEAKSGKLACKKALKLAEKLGCDPSVVGQAANDADIKIVSCSLGCFK